MATDEKNGVTDVTSSVDANVVAENVGNVNVAEVEGAQDLPSEINFGGKKSEKKAPIVPIVIAVVAVIVLIVVGIVVLSSSGKAGSGSFGEASALSAIKFEGDGANLKADEDSLHGLEEIKIDSGVVLKEGDGDVIEVGKQINVNYLMYAYASMDDINGGSQMMQEQGMPISPQDQEVKWNLLGSTWEDKQSMPITVATPKVQEAKALDAFSNSSSSTQQSASVDPITQDFSTLLAGKKVGTVFAYFMPGTGALAAGGTPSQLIIAQVSSEGEVGDDPDTPKALTEVPANAPSVQFDASGKPTGLSVPADFQKSEDVLVKVLSEGNGEVVKGTDVVSAKYAGFLLDGKMFDSSFKRGDSPTQLPLENVIKGWKSGLVGQKVGSKVEIMIPSEYGYGKRGSGSTIPADSYLVFYVDIVKTQDEKSAMAEAQAAQGMTSGSGSSGAITQ
jgi:hypothetical protein